jgi:hypothetical protein
VLMRAESLANDFFKNILNLYSDRPTDEAIKIGRNLLFDFAHLIGIEDEKNFHKKMKLNDPISKLSAGLFILHTQVGLLWTFYQRVSRVPVKILFKIPSSVFI